MGGKSSFSNFGLEICGWTFFVRGVLLCTKAWRRFMLCITLRGRIWIFCAVVFLLVFYILELLRVERRLSDEEFVFVAASLCVLDSLVSLNVGLVHMRVPVAPDKDSRSGSSHPKHNFLKQSSIFDLQYYTPKF
jgi:hypothetical protein